MDFLVVYKWNISWNNDGALSPSIINTMIDMVLGFGTVNMAMYDVGGNTQSMIQLILIIIAIISIPVMWLSPILRAKY